MRILYGVVGEGMGHATRSRVLLDELVLEHEVQVVVSGRAREYLAARFENVHRIWGLSIAYEENSVRNLQTVVRNLKGAVTGWPQNVRKYVELVESFRPDVVVSDFESFSYLFGKNHFIPVVSMDNIQVINRCAHDPALLAGVQEPFELTRALVKAKLPGAFHYLVTSFFQAKVRKERTTLVPSILRPEILAARPEEGEHLLVYQTSTTHKALLEVLAKTPMPCRIYGMRRDLKEDQVEGNLTFRPFSEAGFIEDLRTCKAVLAGGGFTLLSEAVYLHKPILSHPLANQFEQVLNALYLEKLGYGMHAPTLSSEVVEAFLRRLPACSLALQEYQQDGNAVTLRALNEQLALAAAHVGTWREHSRS